jgi:DNA polymerase epsilon subunit 2
VFQILLTRLHCIFWTLNKCLYFYVFCIRYAILHQRTQRHELFTPSILGTNSDDVGYKFKLQPIEFLLGSSGKVSDAIVLGLLTQLSEGRYYLEDPTGILQLDLSEAISFTRHCI